MLTQSLLIKERIDLLLIAMKYLTKYAPTKVVKIENLVLSLIILQPNKFKNITLPWYLQ